ncbi:MAG TPA: plastocyanin/azurin family copper-binding protein [Roseiflexaceae bacterium]|nr:plastocyanin/azurin family copper-binding protein [Roseiflexaceae bacterium]
MKSTVRLWLAGVAMVGALVLSACGGGGGGQTPAGTGGGLNFGTPGENLAFEPATATVAAGSQVSVTFTNNSTAQQHNWVLVNGGDDVAAQVAEAGINAGPPDYLPADKANVIASTKMLQPGGSETISFTAPAAGTYTFLCTYPAHYAGGMKGTLTVQ